MNYYESMQRAEEIIASADSGGFDAALGISPEQRKLLTAAASSAPLSSADIEALNAMGRPDLIAAAYDAGRINPNEGV